MVTTSENF
nr:unnamed protein product [Callosobruchus analis]